MQLHQEVVGGTDADWHRACEGHSEAALKPAAARFGDLRIEAHIQICLGDSLDIADLRSQRCDHSDIDAMHGEQSLDFEHVITASKSQQGRADQIDPRSSADGHPGLGIMLRLIGYLGLQQIAHKLVKRFCCSPVLLFAVRG